VLKRVCIDIDNVLTESDEIMRRLIFQITHGRVSLRPEHIVQFKYQACKDDRHECITDKEWELVHRAFSEEGPLLSLRPQNGARDGIIELSKIFSVHFVTARLQQARRATIAWLEKVFPSVSYGLHFVGQAEKHEVMGEMVAAVEDDFEQALAFANRGVKAVVMDQPWNRSGVLTSNMRRCHGWRELPKILLSVTKPEEA
jgi:uncharacterized HAD superfamily protein